MAGNWEEVVAGGSWIRTRAGTCGELNKHGEADEATENKKGAGETAEGKYGTGEAAAVQANCIWLISGTTVTLNFLKKSMPRMHRWALIRYFVILLLLLMIVSQRSLVSLSIWIVSSE
jgi:hypothetical protein